MAMKAVVMAAMAATKPRGLNRLFTTQTPRFLHQLPSQQQPDVAASSSAEPNPNLFVSVFPTSRRSFQLHIASTPPSMIFLTLQRRILNSISNNSEVFPTPYRLYSTQYDFSNLESRRRTLNRLLYRSKQRGLLELDLVLGKWVEDNIASMDEKGITSLIQVLNQENPDLWRWLSGQEQPPEWLIENPVFTAIRDKVISNLTSYAAPETRAIPGQPWVRGWDDIKKGKDSPVTGNQ